MGRAVLTLVGLWAILSTLGAGVGLAIMHAVTTTRFSRTGDRLFWAWWLGVMLLAWLAFAAALCVPVRSAMPVIVAIAAAAAVRGYWMARSELRLMGAGTWWVLGVVACIVAERSVAIGNLEDTGGYHWSIIQWYEAFGIPPGLALFQWRLATHSSWLALTAAMDLGSLEGRVATVGNGLLFAGCAWFFVLCAVRWIRGWATLAARYAVFALGFLLQQIAKWEMRASPSPDIPVLLGAAVVGWKMLADAEEVERTDGDALTVALFGAALVAVKLNAIPLAVVAAAYFLLRPTVELRAKAAGVAMLALVVAPVLVASWISTGCPLFPISLGCVDIPTGVGEAAARRYGDIISTTARRDIGTGIAASLASLALVLALRRSAPFAVRRRVAWPMLAWPMALAVAGMAFTAAIAPTMRFAAGYLVILPALALAWIAGDARFALAERVGRRVRVSVVLVLVAACAVPLYKEFIHQSLRERSFATWAERKRGDPTINAENSAWWLWPNRMAYAGPFQTARAVDFDYAVSPPMTCWNHPQPCASNPPLGALPAVRLRDPARGLAGGFVHAR